MTKVFIGGSRALGRLNPEVRHRLDTIMEKGHQVLIGDANGADKAVQAYLNSKGYRDVQVFCVGDRPRNNVGHWVLRQVNSNGAKKGFDHYAAKDRVMANEASVGFMVWDGESLGTLMNVCRLIAQSKTTVVFASPKHAFVEVRYRQDWEQIVQGLNSTLLDRLKEQKEAETPSPVKALQGERQGDQQELAF